MANTKRHPAWRMMIAGILLYFGGQGFLQYSVGLYIMPITEGLGISVGVLSMALAVGSLVMIVFMAFVGKIMQKFPIKPLMIVCSILQCVSFILIGQVSSVAALYVLFPLMYLGSAIPCVIVGPMLMTNWFEAKRGFAMGLMTAFGNIGAIVSSQLATYFIINAGYHTAMLVMGVVSLVLSLVAALLTIAHPAMVGLRPLGAIETDMAAKAVELPGITSAIALKSPTFYLTFLIILLLIFVASFTTFLSPLGVSLGLDLGGAANVVMLQQIGALIGAILIGVMNDKLRVKNTSVIVFFLFAAICLGIFFFGSKVSILYVLVVILGFCTSSGGSQPAMLTGKLFGQKDYPGIFSKLTIAMSVSALIAMPFYGFMFDLTGSYLSCLAILAVLGVVMAILVIASFSTAKNLWRKHAGMEMPSN